MHQYFVKGFVILLPLAFIMTFMIMISGNIFTASNSDIAKDTLKLNSELAQIRDAFLKGEVCILDVREKSEWDEAHIQGAWCFPLSEIKKGHLPKNLPADQPIYTQCRRDRRAQDAAGMLGTDHNNITALCVKFSQFEKAGFPITRSQPNKTPI